MEAVPEVGKSWSEAHDGGRRAGCSLWGLSLTNALPESTCSSRQASHRDYREKARREIRAAAGEGDMRHSWHGGLSYTATHTPGVEQGLCPRCPQILAGWLAGWLSGGADLSSLFPPSCFYSK